MYISEYIEHIAQKTESSHLKQLSGIKNYLNALAKFLSCSNDQALMFALVFYQTMEQNDSDFSSLASHLGIPAMRMLKYKPDLDFLLRKRLIRKQDYGRNASNNNNFSYYIPTRVVDGIINNQLSQGFEKMESNYDFIIHVMNEIENNTEENRSLEFLEEEFLGLCSENTSLYSANKLLNSSLKVEDRLLLVFLAYKFMDGDDDVSISEAIQFLEVDKRLQMRERRSLMHMKNDLMVRGFIEGSPGSFRTDNELNITAKGMEYLMGADAVNYNFTNKKKSNEILPEQIKPVKLFHNKGEDAELQKLYEIFSEESLKKVFHNMNNKGMKAGFTVLFYGDPGTGKTESVYQLAHKTGRSIIPVDISHTKSMWFGESEKRIKEIFSQYKETYTKHGDYPILLFNEADAVLGSRNAQAASPVGQTLNAMQNIILQELEDFEGILIATTNLTDMLDKAFDRRFLYKIRFNAPDTSVRQEIIKDKLPFLNKAQVAKLAHDFSMTGGQIANIAKKANVHQILNGTQPSEEDVYGYCENELALIHQSKLGF